ncbi:MAG TPA: urease subunit gamma [Candidatus Limnocylindrales bacterium]|jgi:urease subunit gamma/beta
MRLTAWEEERLLIFSAAELARRHRAAGLALNAPEAIALMCDAMLEAARAGAGYAAVEAAGLAAVAPDQVLPGVRELVDDVRLEVLLGDGARLIVLVDPLGRGVPPQPGGPGAVIQAPERNVQERSTKERSAADAGAVTERRSIIVTNTSHRVVRVSSHFPFDRVNPRLLFDRAAATGFRLDLEAGSTERWSPGEARTVALVRFGGLGGAEATPEPDDQATQT